MYVNVNYFGPPMLILFNIQNSWLGLPSGMSSNTSEFQQALRYQLGASVSKLIALMIVTPITALSCKSVWKVKQNFEAELQNKQVIKNVDTNSPQPTLPPPLHIYYPLAPFSRHVHTL